MSQLSNVHGSGSKKMNAVPQCVQGLWHSLSAIADVKAQLLQSSLMELHSTACRCRLAGAWPRTCILYDERFSKRRVLLQCSHEVEHRRVLMSHETSHRVVPALARLGAAFYGPYAGRLRPLCLYQI